jgi:hypothetical protein
MHNICGITIKFLEIFRFCENFREIFYFHKNLTKIIAKTKNFRGTKFGDISTFSHDFRLFAIIVKCIFVSTLGASLIKIHFNRFVHVWRAGAANPTGVALIVILCIMVLCSMPCVRYRYRSYFIILFILWHPVHLVSSCSNQIKIK